MAVNEAVYLTHAAREARRYGVSFVGREQWRAQDMQLACSQLGIRFLVCERWHSEAAGVWRQSKVGFNRQRSYDLNLRTFEIMMCGAALLTDRNGDNGQDDLFEEGRHYLCYSSPAEIRENIRNLLQNEELRLQIAEAGRQEVLAKHTLLQRAEYLTERLGDLVGGRVR